MRDRPPLVPGGSRSLRKRRTLAGWRHCHWSRQQHGIRRPCRQFAVEDAAHVEPGKTAETIWTFNRAGEFDFACLIPGHYEAGMVGKIVVRQS